MRFRTSTWLPKSLSPESHDRQVVPGWDGLAKHSKIIETFVDQITAAEGAIPRRNLRNPLASVFVAVSSSASERPSV
jgi:hypothetical protein